MSKELSASLEDYLEAIAILSQETGLVRCSDVSQYLHVKKSSVTVALRQLKQREFIFYTPYKPISLTDAGKEIACDVLVRHTTLRDFFVNILGINTLRADEAACKIEHAIGKEITSKLIEFVRDFKKREHYGM